MQSSDKQSIGRRFARAAKTYSDNALFQKEMGRTLLAMLLRAAGTGNFGTVLEIGAGSGLFTDLYEREIRWSHLILSDLSEEFAAFHANRRNAVFCAGDAEKTIWNCKFDLVLSNAAIQWFNDPADFFRRLAGWMNPGAFFVFSTFGPRNFEEIRALCGTGLQYPSEEELQAMLSPYFRVAECKEEPRAMQFASPEAVLRHIRDTGVSAGGEPGVWTKGRLRRFSEEYQARFASEGEGGVVLTYHPIYITAERTM